MQEETVIETEYWFEQYCFAQFCDIGEVCDNGGS